MVAIKKERVLITPKSIKPFSREFEVLGTFNPAAARLPSGDIILYVRVLEKLIKDEDSKYCYSPRLVGEDSYKIKIDRFPKNLVKIKSNFDFLFKDGTKRLTFISHFRRVILDKNGFNVKYIDKKPSFYGLSWDGELGIEDPRISKIGSLYVMTYVSLSRNENVSTSYAISNNCIRWYRRGIIFREQNKDVVIFPEIIGNSYVAFNRPEGNFEFSLPHIWISYSKDLEFWSDFKSVELSKKEQWDSGRVGAGPPPIKTKNGWLLLYHGVIEPKKIRKENKIILYLKKIFGVREYKRLRYCVGAALFDLHDPKKLIAKSKEPIIMPSRSYEKGTFESKNVVFPTGIVHDINQKYILIYSGAGDHVVSVKKIRIKSILKTLLKIAQPTQPSPAKGF